MHYLTAEQIAKDAEHLDGLANIRAINKAFRGQDESGKWPISGRFNVTERAIRRLRREGYDGYGLDYALSLAGVMGEIVNGAV